MHMVRKGFGNKPLKDLTIERKRVEDLKSLLGKDCGWVNLIFFRVSLSKFSLETFFKSWVKGYIYSRVKRNVKSQIFPNRMFWRLGWVASSSREQTAWPGWDFCLVMQQLARRFSFWHAWHVCIILAACSRNPLAGSNCESLLLCTILSNSSHSLTYYPYMILT